MARDQSDREDLFAEARALEPRMEWLSRDQNDPVVLGLRGQSLSVYWTSDCVDHFNGDGLLRRLFRGGELVKAEDCKWVGLRRERVGCQVVMHAEPWSPERTRWELDRIAQRLDALQRAMQLGEGRMLRRVPEQPNDATGEFLAALIRIVRPLKIASTPHAQAAGD